MSGLAPESAISDEAIKLLERHFSHLQDVNKANLVWKRYLSDDQRAQLGHDLEAAYNQGGTVGIWSRIHNVSFQRAIVELAHLLGWLTDADEAWLMEEIGEGKGKRHSRCLPSWDPEIGKLTYRGQVVRQVKRLSKAKNVVKILSAFEEEGWPTRIDDPLEPHPGNERLPAAIKSLNSGLSQIHFRGDGSGSGVVWELEQSAPSV